MASAGLDTYFFPNLEVGQPSNNIALSEIEISLGIMTMLSFYVFVTKNNKSAKTLIICMFAFYFKIAVSEALFHIINHLCSCLEIVLFIPVQFWRQREQDYVSKEKNVWK